MRVLSVTDPRMLPSGRIPHFRAEPICVHEATARMSHKQYYDWTTILPKAQIHASRLWHDYRAITERQQAFLHTQLTHAGNICQDDLGVLTVSNDTTGDR